MVIYIILDTQKKWVFEDMNDKTPTCHMKTTYMSAHILITSKEDKENVKMELTVQLYHLSDEVCLLGEHGLGSRRGAKQASHWTSLVLKLEAQTSKFSV